MVSFRIRIRIRIRIRTRSSKRADSLPQSTATKGTHGGSFEWIAVRIRSSNRFERRTRNTSTFERSGAALLYRPAGRPADTIGSSAARKTTAAAARGGRSGLIRAGAVALRVVSPSLAAAHTDWASTAGSNRCVCAQRAFERPTFVCGGK